MKLIDSLIITMPSIVAVLYSIAGVCYLVKKDYAWATVWLAYALANVGLILIGLRK
jgi:hypothetical protein|tara:strand:- start:2681 stop:2848 length:168 start_codon:yes stop_codon:yes gene_type:complete